jgi:hypothetical protein
MMSRITSNQVQTADHFNTDTSSVTSLQCLFTDLSSIVVEFGLL